MCAATRFRRHWRCLTTPASADGGSWSMTTCSPTGSTSTLWPGSSGKQALPGVRGDACPTALEDLTTPEPGAGGGHPRTCDGLQGVADGPVGLALIEVDAGERGEGLTFEQAVAGLAGEGASLLGAAECLVGVLEGLVGGGQADERDDLRAPGLGLAGKPQGLLVMIDGLLMLAEPL